VTINEVTPQMAGLVFAVWVIGTFFVVICANKLVDKLTKK